MCPFCLATAAVIASSVTGTGGVTALVAGVVMKRSKRKNLPQNEVEEVRHGNNSDGVEDSQDRVAR